MLVIIDNTGVDDVKNIIMTDGLSGTFLKNSMSHFLSNNEMKIVFLL